jgi:hydroxyacid-oxoacid transhydrogenase
MLGGAWTHPPDLWRTRLDSQVMAALDIPNETVFTMETTPIKFGPGATDEVAYDLKRLGVRRPLLVTDPGLMRVGLPDRVCRLLREAGLDVEVYDDVHVEPTDASWEALSSFVKGRDYDGFVAVGGGSAIDSAKAANLFTTYPAPLMDYLNRPVGRGQPVPGPLKPLVAIPTTAGTGSETTAVAVLDVLSLHVKTGISHRALRPTMAVIDPALTLTQPPGVTAASGMDILCHALESYTARPYTTFERKRPEERVPYCGANPIADMWAERALRLLAGAFRTAVRDGSDAGAREQMALAATFAGMGFGNAGVHIPHANAYPIAGRVRDFQPESYPAVMVPHGMAVSLTAPEAFRFTYDADPDRHVRAARMLDPEVAGGPDALPTVLTSLMRDIGIPNGLAAVGYGEGDVDDLVAGAVKQQRLLATAPRSPTDEDLARVFRGSMEHW